MKHLQIFILIITILFLRSCSATFPALAYTQNAIQKSNQRSTVFSQLRKYQKVMITTTDGNIYIGKILEIKKISPPKPKFKNQYTSNLEQGDTITINTKTDSFNGIYQDFDNGLIYFSNEFGNDKSLEMQNIKSIFRKGEIVRFSRVVKIQQPEYILTIRQNKKEQPFNSNDIENIVTIIENKNLFYAFAAGLLIDSLLIYLLLSGAFVTYPPGF